MKSLTLKFLFAAVLALGKLSSAAAQAQPVEVLGASFGVFDASVPGELAFAPTREIPRKAGQRYGWVIELKTRLRHVSVREEYLLPSRQGGEATETRIPMERRSQVSQRGLAVVDGKIYGEWSIGPNEPAGRRHLQVIVENQLAGDFEFEVK